MNRRKFLQSAILGSAAAVVGGKAVAAAEKPLETTIPTRRDYVQAESYTNIVGYVGNLGLIKLTPTTATAVTTHLNIRQLTC